MVLAGGRRRPEAPTSTNVKAGATTRNGGLNQHPNAQVDRAGATPQRCGEVEAGLFDLFASLGASEEQLDFTVLYASAREVGTL